MVASSSSVGASGVDDNAMAMEAPRRESPMWKHERPKEVEKYDLLVEKNRVATRRKAGRRWRERKSQVDCSGACANLTWKSVRA